MNPPSLLGAAIGAPFLHNGAAATLDDVLDRFPAHLHAGNASFDPSADDKAALVAFLESIDEATPIFDIAPDTLACPSNF